MLRAACLTACHCSIYRFAGKAHRPQPSLARASQKGQQGPQPASYLQLALGQQRPGAAGASLAQLAAILAAAGLQLVACAQLAASQQQQGHRVGERQLESSRQLDAPPVHTSPWLQTSTNVLVLLALALGWVRQLQPPR